MTDPTFESRLPGRVLLKLARALFDEPVLSNIVSPVLADLQQEVRDAGDSRTRRLLARLRGYAAFWMLLAAAPFALSLFRARRPVMTLVQSRTGGYLLLVLSVALFVAIWPVFGWFSVAAVTIGALLALALRLWNNSHPSSRAPVDPLVAVPASVLFVALGPMFVWFVVATVVVGALLAVGLRRWNDLYPSTLVPADSLTSRPGPEINMSSIPVAGDIGGLFFVVGAIVIVLLGLPDVRWFVLASVIVGGVMAKGLSAWRSAHAGGLTPANSILRR